MYRWKDGTVHNEPEKWSDPMPDEVEAECIEAYKNKYGSALPGIGFTLWREIWRKGYLSK